MTTPTKQYQPREVFQSAPYGFLATWDGQAPRLRPHAFVLQAGKLWTSTYDISGKVTEIENTPAVEVAFVGNAMAQLRVSGHAAFVHDRQQKELLLELNPKVRRHFPDADAEHFVLIEITPTRIRTKATGFCEYVDFPLDALA